MARSLSLSLSSQIYSSVLWIVLFLRSITNVNDLSWRIQWVRGFDMLKLNAVSIKRILILNRIRQFFVKRVKEGGMSSTNSSIDE